MGAPSRQFIAGYPRLKLSMKVHELAPQLSKYIELGHAEDDVVIALRESSVGPEAAEEVEYCEAGFDWDNGRVFFVPKEPLVHYGNERDKAQPAIRISYGGKIRPTLHCPRCEAKLSKEMRYCPKCGQSVDTENVRDAMI